jgi:hypothetical protein
MNPPSPSPSHRCDDELGELGRRPDRTHGARPNNRSGNPTGRRFFAIAGNDVGQLLLAEPIHQIRRRERLPAIHPHVERPLAFKAESSLRRLQLKRRHTQIRQNAINLSDASATENDGHLSEVGSNDLTAGGKPAEPVPGHLQSLFIAVQGDHTHAIAGLQQGLGVSPRAHRAINKQPSPFGPEHRHRFHNENRTMKSPRFPVGRLQPHHHG